ncbi:NTP transferase domain-containing protein [Microbacterium sp. ZW T2_14]|uniref:nucleotidyltransferase family protein n=1 Tax=Microbacterium sp. ZW T2_14 TaxID=3378079 RepID=UPI003852778E
MRICGIVLAAGAGTRYGSPKGLARTADGEPWVARAIRTLRDGGCDQVLVVVGARADEVAALVPDARVVEAADWAAGLSASLRAGLRAAQGSASTADSVPGADHGAFDAVIVLPVDTPDAPAAVVRRVIATLRRGAPLVQAVYEGMPGHPVAIERSHFAALSEALGGDRGARPYLVTGGVVEVECGDLWSGADIDHR